MKIAAGRSGISIHLTGLGRKNAERAIRDFFRQNNPAFVPFVFTCGFAGGLNPELAVGDVVFSTTDANAEEWLTKAGARSAKFFCAPRIAVTAAEKQELRRTTGADAVEMESEIIQAVCREQDIPCVTVRAISDAANEDLPVDFNRMLAPGDRISIARIALECARMPSKVAGLLRLQKKTALAPAALARTLAAVIFR